MKSVFILVTCGSDYNWHFGEISHIEIYKTEEEAIKAAEKYRDYIECPNREDETFEKWISRRTIDENGLVRIGDNRGTSMVIQEKII